MARHEASTGRSDTAALGKRTARGFFWLMVQTVGTKTVNIGSQIALAWLLAPEHFDLIALVYTITMLLGLLRDAGMRDVLVHRHHSFGRWAGAAFWLSLTTGVLVGLLTVASIPLALALYKEPELTGLLLVSAIGAPINTLGTVSDALLRSQMRFRVLAMIGLGVFTGTSLMTVALAALGFGAYSWVIPQPILWLVRSIVLWWVAKPNFSLKPRFRRWKYLIGDNLKLIAADFAIVGTLQGDRAVLGAMFPATVMAGIYFFAINLTAQSVRLFVQNLTRVLFPALSKLQDDPRRQGRAFLRATSLLALIGVPLCLVQMPLADPLIRLLFQPKWHDAIIVIQLLSVGMVGRLMMAPSRGMFMAQGRFGILLTMSVINAVTFIAMVIIGAWIGGEAHGLIGVAAAASAGMFLYGPVQIYVAAKPTGGTCLDVWKTYALPLAASALAVAASWLGSRGVSAGVRTLITSGAWLPRLCEVMSVLVLMASTYIAIIAVLAPNDLREVKSRLRDMLASRKKKQRQKQSEDEGEAVEEIAEVEEKIRMPDE
jgi:O-antigen/teichoic acid export membrane protein